MARRYAMRGIRHRNNRAVSKPTWRTVETIAGRSLKNRARRKWKTEISWVNNKIIIKKLTCELPPWTDTPWLSILCDILTLKLTLDRILKKKKSLWQASVRIYSRSENELLYLVLVICSESFNSLLAVWTKPRRPRINTRADRLTHTQIVSSVYIS